MTALDKLVAFLGRHFGPPKLFLAVAASILALGAWGVQLSLNLSWSMLFFGARMIGAALVEIAVLLAAILITAALFWRIDRIAGVLLVPYAAWVGFATVLNAALWRLN